jgi:hypothetical protein
MKWGADNIIVTSAVYGEREYFKIFYFKIKRRNSIKYYVRNKIFCVITEEKKNRKNSKKWCIYP